MRWSQNTKFVQNRIDFPFTIISHENLGTWFTDRTHKLACVFGFRLFLRQFSSKIHRKNYSSNINSRKLKSCPERYWFFVSFCVWRVRSAYFRCPQWCAWHSYSYSINLCVRCEKDSDQILDVLLRRLITPPPMGDGGPGEISPISLCFTKFSSRKPYGQTLDPWSRWHIKMSVCPLGHHQIKSRVSPKILYYLVCYKEKSVCYKLQHQKNLKAEVPNFPKHLK